MIDNELLDAQERQQTALDQLLGVQELLLALNEAQDTVLAQCSFASLLALVALIIKDVQTVLAFLDQEG